MGKLPLFGAEAVPEKITIDWAPLKAATPRVQITQICMCVMSACTGTICTEQPVYLIEGRARSSRLFFSQVSLLAHRTYYFSCITKNPFSLVNFCRFVLS